MKSLMNWTRVVSSFPFSICPEICNLRRLTKEVFLFNGFNKKRRRGSQRESLTKSIQAKKSSSCWKYSLYTLTQENSNYCDTNNLNVLPSCNHVCFMVLLLPSPLPRGACQLRFQKQLQLHLVQMSGEVTGHVFRERLQTTLSTILMYGSFILDFHDNPTMGR